MPSVSLNRQSHAILQTIMQNAESLQVKVHKLPNGTRVVDAGVKAVGSLRAGLLISRVALGGLGEVTITQQDYGDLNLPTVHVIVDQPALSLFCCQYPVPTIDLGDYKGIWSGPGKIHIRQPKRVFKLIDYAEPSKIAVFLVQSDDLPDAKVASKLARLCKVKPSQLSIVVVPTRSVAGAVQVAARVLEDPLGRAVKVLHYPLNRIKAMIGSAPLSPVYPDIWRKPGLTPDDMLFYASRITFLIDARPSDDLQSLATNLTSAVLPRFGMSFYEMLKDVNFVFERLDSPSYASASITIYDTSSGRLYQAGKLHLDLIKKTAGLS
jgi:methenyltetrahydromethanopterin cyclohydrolase